VSFIEVLDDIRMKKGDMKKFAEMVDVFEKLRIHKNDYITECDIMTIVVRTYFPKDDPLYEDAHDFLLTYMCFTRNMSTEDRLKVKELFIKYIS
jgi:succinyl-CoA synthetase alpha subunit